MKKLIIFVLCLLSYIGTFSNISSANDKKVGVMFDERFLLHDTGPNHPENPDRLISVIRDLKIIIRFHQKLFGPILKLQHLTN